MPCLQHMRRRPVRADSRDPDGSPRRDVVDRAHRTVSPGSPLAAKGRLPVQRSPLQPFGLPVGRSRGNAQPVGMLSELIDVPAGSFRMGSADFYPKESPVHDVAVAPFAIERHTVTNAQFAEFVCATGYVTVAAKLLHPAAFPGAPPRELVAGALVFRPTAGPVDLPDWWQWWTRVPGACWKQPCAVAPTIRPRRGRRTRYPSRRCVQRPASVFTVTSFLLVLKDPELIKPPQAVADHQVEESNWLLPNGSTGAITATSTNTAETSRRSKWRPTTPLAASSRS